LDEGRTVRVLLQLLNKPLVSVSHPRAEGTLNNRINSFLKVYF